MGIWRARERPHSSEFAGRKPSPVKADDSGRPSRDACRIPTVAAPPRARHSTKKGGFTARREAPFARHDRDQGHPATAYVPPSPAIPSGTHAGRVSDRSRNGATFPEGVYHHHEHRLPECGDQFRMSPKSRPATGTAAALPLTLLPRTEPMLRPTSLP
ncbi:hypothetical protein SAMN03159335_03217 [Burkholderia cepacia]|nr:hypothetical protein SAMN03159335_03217 [Burkholderia cepacia]